MDTRPVSCVYIYGNRQFAILYMWMYILQGRFMDLKHPRTRVLISGRTEKYVHVLCRSVKVSIYQYGCLCGLMHSLARFHHPKVLIIHKWPHMYEYVCHIHSCGSDIGTHYEGNERLIFISVTIKTPRNEWQLFSASIAEFRYTMIINRCNSAWFICKSFLIMFQLGPSPKLFKYIDASLIKIEFHLYASHISCG